MGNNKEFLNNLWFSGEAHFLLNGHVNSKNWVFWESESRWMFSAFKKVHSMDCRF